ncbi:MAG: type IX secretion system sortase PorU [Bacteroidales bacterium]|nr:type IX secretion system sortase PorU [Bacteroidales bacterium]
MIIGLLCAFAALSVAFSAPVMSSGEWYQVYVVQDGVYRITYEELRDMGLSDPARVRIYGAGGAMLPETADVHSSDDIREIPVMMVCQTDGVFTHGDYVLFYGQGPVVWQYNINRQKFEHTVHLWDSKSVYFITSQAGGKRITADTPPTAPPTHAVTTFDERLYYEQELTNLLNSGRFWYGEFFYAATPQSFSFTAPDLVSGIPVQMEAAFLTRSTVPAYLEIRHGGQIVANRQLGVYGQEYAVETLCNASFTAESGNISVELSMNRNGNANAQGWLNFIRLQARRRLNMTSPQLLFRDTQSAGDGNVSVFTIANASETQVWDVTDMYNVLQMNVSTSADALNFTAATDSLREFVAFRRTEGWLKPVFPENPRVENQNLHDMDADMLIVTHPDFWSAAQELADLHRTKDGLTVATVTTNQTYNEFSSGKQDPAAIRNFTKTVYERSGKLKYLLLMGKGSFDNKSNLVSSGKASANTNFVATYQSAESLHNMQSYVSDDYFGILDDGEAILGGKLKIGVGRIPVKTAEEAQIAVNKIRKYMETPPNGTWANLIALLADDEDENIHTAQSDSIAEYLQQYQLQYTLEKLYFDAFPQTPTADGHRYPEVTEQLNGLLNNGCFLINYIGHGNATGLSEERVIYADGIDKWKNKIFPLFVVATCEFGRYDDYLRTTAGEKIILNPNGGGIALLTSTRLVYSKSNFQLTKNFFRSLFVEPATDKPYRLGDFIRLSKNASDTDINKLCFTLLGDPALALPLPTNKVRTVAVNGRPVEDPLDTLKSGALVTIKAEITDRNGQKMTSFNGMAHISLFDKSVETYTQNNDHVSPPMQFITQTSVLYRGKSTVRNGEFETTFIMPRDMLYRYGFGKISYWAYSNNETATGAFDRITVGGAVEPPIDATGPEIRLFMNDTLFRDGGITDRRPVLIALLSDESGISASGGVGHDIAAMLDNNLSATYTLNAYYEACPDNYRKGQVTYRFSELPAGTHELSFSAWDMDNNASQAFLRFRVTHNDALRISNLYNYPNPFSGSTFIYFEHNLPDEPMEVEIQIFDLSGKLLRTIKQSLTTEGYTSRQLQWDGHTANGSQTGSGIYPYRVILRTGKGQEATMTSKMMIIR